eukprot:43251-Chlamydomonas_euryale.AAC.1
MDPLSHSSRPDSGRLADCITSPRTWGAAPGRRSRQQCQAAVTMQNAVQLRCTSRAAAPGWHGEVAPGTTYALHSCSRPDPRVVSSMPGIGAPELHAPNFCAPENALPSPALFPPPHVRIVLCALLARAHGRTCDAR